MLQQYLVFVNFLPGEGRNHHVFFFLLRTLQRRPNLHTYMLSTRLFETKTKKNSDVSAPPSTFLPASPPRIGLVGGPGRFLFQLFPSALVGNSGELRRLPLVVKPPAVPPAVPRASESKATVPGGFPLLLPPPGLLLRSLQQAVVAAAPLRWPRVFPPLPTSPAVPATSTSAPPAQPPPCLLALS